MYWDVVNPKAIISTKIAIISEHIKLLVARTGKK